MNADLTNLLETLGKLRALASLHVVPEIVTQQGVRLSIQGSARHLSLPRENFRVSYSYYEILVWKISDEGSVPLPEWALPYALDEELLAYVPADKLASLADFYGGVDVVATLKELHNFQQAQS